MFKVTLMDYSTNKEVYFLINNKIKPKEFCQINDYLKSITKTTNIFNISNDDKEDTY